MGNKLAREFEKRASVEAGWERAKKDERPFFEDVSVFGIGIRRLTLIYCPSFNQGYAWDIRELDDRLRVFRSIVRASSARITGYDLLQFESKPLRDFLARLHAIRIALHPTGGSGFDGTTIHLGLFSRGSAELRLSWWGAPQDEWKEIAAITDEMRVQFSAAPSFETCKAELSPNLESESSVRSSEDQDGHQPLSS